MASEVQVSFEQSFPFYFEVMDFGYTVSRVDSWNMFELNTVAVIQEVPARAARPKPIPVVP